LASSTPREEVSASSFGETGKPAADEPRSVLLEGQTDAGKLAAVAAKYGIETPPGR